jgi:hypothetical protein
VRRLGGERARTRVYRTRSRLGLLSRLRGASEALLDIVEERQGLLRLR